MKRRRFVIGTLALVALTLGTIVAVPAQPAVAQADWERCPNEVAYGRQMCNGYFTNRRDTSQPYPENAVFYNGMRPQGVRDRMVGNVDEYVSLIRAYLYDNDGSQNVNYGSGDPAILAVQNSDARRNNIGAAHQIAVMMGRDGGFFGGSVDNGISWARSNFSAWETVVRSYGSQGRIDFNVMAISLDSSGGRIAHSSGLPPGNDDNMFFRSDFYTTLTLRIRNASNVPIFQLELDCGNIFGIRGSLVQPPSGDINPPTPGTPTTPPGYNTGDTNVYSSCTTVAGHAVDPSDNNYQVPVTVIYRVNGTEIARDNTIRAANSGTRSWTAATPAVVRNSISPVTVEGTYQPRSGGAQTLTNSPITIGPCMLVTPACAGATVAPTSLDPGTRFTVTANVRYTSTAEASAVMAQANTRLFITINGPNVNRSFSYAPTGSPPTITQSGSLLTVTTPSQDPTGATGRYNIGYGITGTYGAINCGATNPVESDPPHFNVYNKPYFTVQNGDISAGAGMSVGGNECAAGGVPANQNAGIASWNRGTAGNYAGAGTQYGALTLGLLQEFATGQGSGLAPSGAAFANTGATAPHTDLGQGLYGGKFGGIGCTGDYFKDVNPSVIQGSQTIGNISVPNCNGTNDSACRRVIYVDGNVFINGNITFSGNYANTSQIPSFSIVVRGNIYIAPGVTRLDGFYIAQPSNASATNGIIYTCATSSSGAPALDTSLGTTCNTTLQVNGAFSARQVWLLRTAGTISSTPAESFNYSPESWLSVPFGNGLNPATTDDYDAITSLPPVL